MPSKTLCLNMIVKNEVANLDRCLRSVVDHISCWVIGDTGSTDGTQEAIRTFFAERGIPGELHKFPFRNFAQARNEALLRARKSSLKFDYLLLLDADMELTVQYPAFAEDLAAGAYRVVQNSGVSYWNNRLLARHTPARYVGVTHEYLDVLAGQTESLAGIAFIDHATGSNRADKFRRDIRLLTDQISKEHDQSLVARYTFYLANSLRDNGDHKAALKIYLRRTRLGYWDQEVFVSLLNAARLKEKVEYPDEEVIAAYQKAASSCVFRAEALHGVSRFCRMKAIHEQGYHFAAKGLEIEQPHEALFREDWIYQYGLLDELAINAYWTARYAECVVACDRLLSEGKLPEEDRDRVRRNKQFASDKLKEAAVLPNESSVSSIPKIFHFITGLDEQFGEKPFSFVHYVAIMSALQVNEGFVARVYYQFEPSGPYWDRIKPHVVCVPIVAPTEFHGHPVRHFANRADIVRLRLLYEHGGIYLDIDTICQRPFEPLLQDSVVMGLEETSDNTTIGLCNATVIAPPRSEFIQIWLDSHNDFTVWNRFAVQIPMQLAKTHPHLIKIEPPSSFFWPPWDEVGISKLFVEDHFFPDAYCFHLWESKSWPLFKDLDERRVLEVNTTYNRVARRFVSDDRDLELKSVATTVATVNEPRFGAVEAGALKQLILEATAQGLGRFWDNAHLHRRLDMMIENYWSEKLTRCKNPLLKAGNKYFSQSDEDGITLEILRRIGCRSGIFVEFGVGNGLENNTLILLMHGWQGVWIGGEDLSFSLPQSSTKLRFAKEWVTLENCVTLLSSGLEGLGHAKMDYLSVDLDGNDLHITDAILKAGFSPAVVVVEYHGKFPPPIRWVMNYNPLHRWAGDDYQGASLQSYIDLLDPHGYQLVCCNLTGVNAFFVNKQFVTAFEDVPIAPSEIFMHADYNWFVARGHAVSARTIEQFV